MIRLKYILLESKQIPNVLFVSDNGLDKSKGYARKLISAGIVTGEIYTANEQSAEELVPLVYYNIASGYYDAVVVQCSGLYDDNEENILDKFQLINDICKRKQIEPIFVTIPTDRFVTDNKYSKINIDKINDWITTNTTYVDLSKINDDIYFTNDGKRLNKLGNSVIYERLKDIFSSYKEETTDLAIKTKTEPKKLRKIQQQLVKLGYDINSDELKYIKSADSTKTAIEQFQLKNGLTPTGELNKQTLTKLFSITAIAAVATNEPQFPEKIKRRLGKSGENTDAMEVMKFLIDKGLSIAGAAGIAGNMQVESAFKTDALGDRGTSIGLVQWHKSNKDALFSWCEQKNMDPLSYEGQMAFLWFELETKFRRLKSYLQTTEDPRDAAYRFADDFENPAVISPKRMDYAEEFFNEYNESGSSIGTLKSIWNNVKTAATIGTAIAAGSFASKSSSTKNGKLSSAELISIGNGQKLEPKAAAAFLEMEKLAKVDGIKFNVTDSYRTLEIQNAIFDWDLYNRTGQKKKKGTNGRVAAAYPGTSNHGLGKAIDVFPTSAQNWIKKNGEQFGWSWDEGRSVGEPWHFRYIK